MLEVGDEVELTKSIEVNNYSKPDEYFPVGLRGRVTSVRRGEHHPYMIQLEGVAKPRCFSDKYLRLFTAEEGWD